jgi:arylsulfatase A-like enzyme
MMNFSVIDFLSVFTLFLIILGLAWGGIKQKQIATIHYFFAGRHHGWFVIIAGCFLTLSFSTIFSSSAKDVKKPNVLFIAIDDLNDWTSILGGRSNVYTPNMDRLAAQGVIFTNAHCAAPACNPSRTSVFTGIRPSTSGVYFNRSHWRSSPALKNAVTIPEYFRSNGYRVVGGGKLFHALSWIQTDYGKSQNDPEIWDEYFPSKTKPMPDFVWPKEIIDEDERISWDPLAAPNSENRPDYFFDWGPLKETDEKTADYKVVDWAIEELQKKHEKPFFQAVGIFRPHIPWFVPQKYFDLYPLENIDLPLIQENDLDDCSDVGKSFCKRKWQEWIVKNDLWKESIQAYMASISYADAQLGRLLDAFEKSDYADNTIIVLWSDHGMHIGEKEHWEKFTLWEESTRVPLIFVAPGISKSGTRSDEPVNLLDIYPTLIELSGGEQNLDLEGKSLLPLLQDPSLETNRAVVTTFGKNNHGVRSKRWRYIHYNDGSEELYDHQNDPNEFTNIAYNKEFEKIKKDLAKWLPEINNDSVN